jgi:hypothetical protein
MSFRLRVAQFRSGTARPVGAFCRFLMTSKQIVLSALAKSFLASDPTVEQLTEQGSRTLGRHWPWLLPMARRYAEFFAGRIRPRERDVIRFLAADPDFRTAWRKSFRRISVVQWLMPPQPMQPVRAARNWEIPAIETVGALADWLGVTPSELEWFADLKGLNARKNIAAQLSHYRCRVLVKRSGNLRLIEAPKQRLKELQRKILTGILDHIPPHPAVHGFQQERSIKTFVAPHTGKRVVLRMDIQDFFPCFIGARVQAFFRTAGYPELVADLLGGICTNAAPKHAWNGPEKPFDLDPALLRDAQALYSRVHLPQGAPTSPALANLCFYRVDCRLAGLAKAAGAEYTRYADDLAFSGGEEFEKRVERFSIHVAAILLEEGFAAHYRKTRIMRQGVRQHLAGLVANRRVNVRRSDFDQLKAILTNCTRHGPESQNRAAHPQFRLHLEGRVGFVEMVNPKKGKRLRRIFEQIRWE